ncbi:DoxX-like family protein [Acidovorax sp. Q11]
MTPAAHALLRWSLVFVWLATALVSVVELNGQSRALLVSLPPAWSSIAGLAPFLILAGAAADAALGVWMAWRPGRAAYLAALVLMGIMTLLASAIDPSWWLHPLGPLTKNLPIAAILLVLLQDERAKSP